MKKTLIPALALAAGLSAHAQYSAVLPAERQFVVTPGFTYSYFDEFWLDRTLMDNPPNGKRLDQYVGYLTVEYGICPKFAADVTAGYTWTDTGAFGDNKDEGTADTLFGLRYRVWDEFEHEDCWLPTVSLRVGGIIAGDYDEALEFSAGDGAHGAEASILFSRQICPGFGVFGDIGYRYREADVPEDLFGSLGVYAAYRNWSLSLAYRHVQGLGGRDIMDPGFMVDYGFPQVKEITQNAEAGLGYTDDGGRFYQVFYARTIDGRNTGKKNIFGISASFPFGGK